MSILEAFIHRNFIIAQQIETLKTSIPPKQKRQKPDVSETGPTT
jgi:hypothetical protein